MPTRYLSVNIDSLDLQLLDFLKRVGKGEEIIILENEEPVAKLCGVRSAQSRRKLKQAIVQQNYPVEYPKPLPDGIVWASARLPLDGQNGGKPIEKSDEELAAEQGVSVEDIREARTRALSRAYELILSWPATNEEVSHPDEPPSPSRTRARKSKKV